MISKNNLLDQILSGTDIYDIALIDENENQITYKQLYVNIVDREKKIKKDSDFIYLCFSSQIELLYFIFAAWKANIVPIVVKKDQITYFIDEFEDVNNNSNKKAVVYSDFLSKDNHLLCNVPLKKSRIKELNKYKHKNLAAIFLTSGSEAIPKMVPFSVCQILEALKLSKKYFKVKNKVIELLVLPLSSSTSFVTMALVTLSVSGTAIILNNITNFHSFAKVVSKYKIDFMGVTPTLLKLYLNNMEVSEKLCNINNIVIGGEPCEIKLLKRLQKDYGAINIFCAYGLTETIIPICGITAPSNYNGSVGKMCDEIEYKIIDEDGNKVNYNEVGELLLRGKVIVSDRICVNGLTKKEWLKTGDLVKVDINNELWIVGRKKEIAIISGKNISLNEIKNTIQQCRGVTAVKLQIKQDDITGEKIVAKVFVNEETLSKKDIIEQCKKNLSSYKIPKDIEILSDNNIKLRGLGKL